MDAHKRNLRYSGTCYRAFHHDTASTMRCGGDDSTRRRDRAAGSLEHRGWWATTTAGEALIGIFFRNCHHKKPYPSICQTIEPWTWCWVWQSSTRFAAHADYDKNSVLSFDHWFGEDIKNASDRQCL